MTNQNNPDCKHGHLGREHYRAEWEKCVNEIDRLSHIEDKYVNLCAVLNEQAGEIQRRDQQLKESVDHETEYMAEIERLKRERDEWAAKWHKVRVELAELKYPGMKGVIRPMQAGEIIDLKEQIAALESREVCTVAHEDVEMCGYCQRDAIEAELERIAQARLTWAMACQCTCDACESFSSVIRKACFQSEASSYQGAVTDSVDVPR